MHSDPLVQRFESWARSRLKDGFSLDEAADAVGSSKRTLARRMQTVLGKSPLSYFQSLRVERAVHLLKTSSASVDEIAVRVGYTEGSILRVLLRRQLGIVQTSKVDQALRLVAVRYRGQALLRGRNAENRALLAQRSELGAQRVGSWGNSVSDRRHPLQRVIHNVARYHYSVFSATNF